MRYDRISQEFLYCAMICIASVYKIREDFIEPGSFIPLSVVIILSILGILSVMVFALRDVFSPYKF